MNPVDEQRMEDLARILDDAAELLSKAIEYAENELRQPVYTAVQDAKMFGLTKWRDQARATLKEANTLI